MEQDNVKWKYNKDKHEVVEQPTMKYPHITYLESNNSKGWLKVNEDYDAHIATLRHIPVSGKVYWKDGDDVTGKFKEQIQYLYRATYGEIWFATDAHSYQSYQRDNNYNTKQNIIAIPINIQEQPIKKPDYNSGWYEKNQVGQQQYQSDLKKWQSKNQSQEQDNVTSGVWDEIPDVKALCEKYLPNQFRLESFKPKQILILKSAFDQGARVIYNTIKNKYQSRIQSLEASNNFHKQQAEEAIQEQLRLKKELDEFKESISELTLQQAQEIRKRVKHYNDDIVAFNDWFNKTYPINYDAEDLRYY